MRRGETHASIFFTVDGELVAWEKAGFRVGTPYKHVERPERLRPTVGLHSPGERVRLRFGGPAEALLSTSPPAAPRPFAFDLNGYLTTLTEALGHEEGTGGPQGAAGGGARESEAAATPRLRQTRLAASTSSFGSADDGEAEAGDEDEEGDEGEEGEEGVDDDLHLVFQLIIRCRVVQRPPPLRLWASPPHPPHVASATSAAEPPPPPLLSHVKLYATAPMTSQRRRWMSYASMRTPGSAPMPTISTRPGARAL